MTRPPAEPVRTGSLAAVICLVLGGLGAATALNPDGVFISLFFGLGGLAALPLALSDVSHLPDRVRGRVRLQALAGGALSLIALVLVVGVLLGAEQRDAIERSALVLLR